MVVQIITSILRHGDVSPKNVAIITPYSKQVQLIRMEFAKRATGGSNSIDQVKVGTVDSFQGQETDLVIFSAVRSNELKELGFLRDSRRLNVAITRAKRGLILIGDKTLLRTCRHWNALLDSCERRGCLIDVAALKEDEKSCNETHNVEKKHDLVNLNDSEDFFGLFSS